MAEQYEPRRWCRGRSASSSRSGRTRPPACRPTRRATPAEAIVDADGHGTVDARPQEPARLHHRVSWTGGSTRSRTSAWSAAPKAAAIIDADNAQGMSAAAFGMRKAIELAKEYSLGSAFVREQQPLRPLRLLVQHGRSTEHGRVRRSPTPRPASRRSAARSGLIGNNPPSWAIPTRVVDPSNELPAAEYQPVFLDMALSVVAANRLDIYRRRGEPLPDGLGARQGRRADRPIPSRAARRHDHGGRRATRAPAWRSCMSMITSFLGGSPPDTDRLTRPHGGSASPGPPATGSRRTTWRSSRIWRRSRARPARPASASKPRRRGPASSGCTRPATSRTRRRGAPGERHPAGAVHPGRSGLGRRARRASNTT